MRSHIGSRRSFICRVKLGHQLQQQQQLVQHQIQQQQYLDNANSSLSPNSYGLWSTNSRSNRNRNVLQTTLDPSSDKSNGLLYSVVHITGYTKVWPPNSNGSNANNQQNMMDPHGNMYHNHHHLGLEDHSIINPSSTNFHLIAIARIQMTSAPTDLVNASNIEFVTRHDQNGLITFVDQRYVFVTHY